ncbi:MAG: hypothetical protein KBT77_11525 [Thalassolituus oleivorans]|uniref:hypothetical protein n=1 Tax=Thalassolituus oleivorans TaxID=187493 RepID=UPI001B565CDC|nr:hypothetical protein [Thalassolituus oleivorans]MBQ0727966.1 hypothetical protein [Thalassolituus oleivorans]MBQ0781689.1 hypothetical protein [Thalassolituus oleivorans]
MKFIDDLRTSLDSSGVTNPSKLYTPFTLFCIYFAIYFKAEILGRIFLASDWNVIHSALTDLSSPSVIEWFTFASKVAAYSLGMILLYGLAQIMAASIWGVSNLLNSIAAAKIEKGSYIHHSIIEKEQQKLQEAYKREKELSATIESYHEWTPERVSKLFNENKNLKDKVRKIEQEKGHLLDHNNKLSESNEAIAQESANTQNLLTSKKSEYDNLQKKMITVSSQCNYHEGRSQTLSLLLKSPMRRDDRLKGLSDGLKQLKLKDFLIDLVSNIDKKSSFENSEVKIEHGKLLELLKYFEIGRHSSSSSDIFTATFSFTPVEKHQIRSVLELI